MKDEFEFDGELHGPPTDSEAMKNMVKCQELLTWKASELGSFELCKVNARNLIEKEMQKCIESKGNY